MNKKALLCKIKKVYYSVLRKEIYAGYIQSVIDGFVVTRDGHTKFEANDTSYIMNLKKVGSHTKNHSFIERAFTFIDEDKYDEIVGEFVIIDVQEQEIKTINDVCLWNFLCQEFDINKYVGSDNFDNKEETDIVINYNTNEISYMYQNIMNSIVGQDIPIKNLLSSIYFNQQLFNNINSELSKFRQNVLIKGGTGTGKTETIKMLSKYYKLPITIEDATTYTVSGYVGNDVDDMLKRLYMAAGEDLELAQKGIIVIDEFDKLSALGNERNEVKYLGVQKSLLKLLDGEKVYLSKSQNDQIGGFGFDTSKVTFIVLGAFDGIEDIIQKRLKQKGNIGFGNNNMEQINSESGCIPRDFIDYGMMSQLIGRFSQIIEMNDMSHDILKNILLKSNNSVLLFYKNFLSQKHIEFEYDETFIEAVSKKAFEMKCGARSLKTIIDGVMNKYMFDILSGKIFKIFLTSEDVYGVKDKEEIKIHTKKMGSM